MMTAAKLERITGHEPITEHNAAGWLASCECHCDGEAKVIVADSETTESGALAVLLHEVYRHHRFIVCTRAGWKCSECGRAGGLDVDHVVPRSKGRDDRVSNLRAVCASFTGCAVHQRKHG